MGALENESQSSQNYIFRMKFSQLYLCFHNSCEIWHSLSRTPMRNFLWCYYRWQITSLGLEKCEKEYNNSEIILKPAGMMLWFLQKCLEQCTYSRSVEYWLLFFFKEKPSVFLIMWPTCSFFLSNQTDHVWYGLLFWYR